MRASRRRRLRAALVAAAALATAVAALLLVTVAPRDSSAQQGVGDVTVEGWPSALGLMPLGGAAQAGEVWAIRRAAGRGTEPQPMLARYRAAEGWTLGETAVDEQGHPYGGAALRDGRVTPAGGIVLVGDDERRPDGEQQVVLARDPGGPPRVLPAPPAGMLLPRDGSVPAEALSGQVLAARDMASGTEAFLGIAGRPLQTGIARWADAAWTREPICVAADAGGTPPADCSPAETLTGAESSLRIVALAAAEGRAWALAHAEATPGAGPVLFERVDDGGTPRWRRRTTAAPLFDVAATPARAVDAVRAIDSGWALTATPQGVWIDGSFRFRAEPRSVTIFTDGATATTWCDAEDTTGALCDHPLGIALAAGQRSFAWPGAGHGERIVGPVALDGSRALHYATFSGDAVTLRPTFAQAGAALAFATPTDGWAGNVRVTREAWTSPIAPWSVPVRRPLTAIAGEPGRSPGALDAQALAVGLRGTILRYRPGQGWDSEALLSAGGVATPALRGVAWPSPEVAHAVGDEGAMWRWRQATGLWEPDPAAPFDDLTPYTGIAFQPGVPERGYVVGRAGTLLRYGKSWEREPLPPETQTGGPLGGPVDLMAVAFAGSQALVAAQRHLLVNDGAGWRVDSGAQELIDRARGTILTVAGLPDGGAVAAGDGVVIERDGPGAPWRYSAQPPQGVAVAAAAFRDGAAVRALISIAPAATEAYPLRDELQPAWVDPNAPPPRLGGFTLPADGYLVRETATGWRDEDRSMIASPTADTARKHDPVLALLTGAAGSGWLVGGWNDYADSVGRGTPPAVGPLQPQHETAAVGRYDAGGPQGSDNVRPATVELNPGRARFAVGGGARCRAACAQLRSLGVAPDPTLARALALAGQLAARPAGPRALLYTGGRAAVSGIGEQQRFAELMSAATLPLLAAIGDGEAAGDSDAYEQAFATFPAPLGTAAPPSGIAPVALGAAATAARARTHFAADSDGPEGPVRIVVIDNATGSLAARDGAGNPVEDQKAWLRTVLADARTRGIPAIVVGNRSLSARTEGAAADGDEVAAILRDNGASAYVFEGSQEHRATTIPTGSGEVPQFATGTLGYRDPTATPFYDATGLLLLELDLAGRDPATNRAPASVRLLPVIEELALEAVDGRVLARSQPGLFRGLGRRPRSGDVEDNYVALPSDQCTGGNRCTDRIDPEVRFSSSDPDIAQFVRLDRSSPNPRKPFVDPATDKVVPDASSGLLCTFNAGTTTVTIEAGGLAYSTTVTVRDGSVLRPCGTMPLDPRRFPSPPPSRPAVTPPPPPPASTPPEDDPPPVVPPPPPPAEQPVVAPPVARAPQPRPAPRPPPTPRPQPEPSPVPQAIAPPGLVPLAPLLPPPSVARPIPPSGTAPVSINVPVAQPVAQVERQREEEEALEQSQAYVRVSADHDPGRVAVPLIALILLAAAGAGAIRRPRRDRGYAYADDQYRRFRR
ncbi:hypothetical protein VSS74_17105 [Conexibacter stalactiti]|uniref:Calcineurin-like phosphoesterase domain-containing protein n=1 Tax=Conexibacter stalactiti TaxID=1940611 RepID=A0ABU4HS17_9ACTN|nr:hypothetical protein [Conexibacter stalactiti]MDW5596068.1 hypothetical protein [Conexibacter stalactiti]MEC5036710.1 hypothetical protein [Conexibacter stalactiti]